MKPSFLLITKNYPPQIGGIEKYSSDLYDSLRAEWSIVKIIKAGPRNEWLLQRSKNPFWKILYIITEISRLSLFFLSCCTFGTLYSFQSDIIWSLDGSIGWIWVLLTVVSKKRSQITLHGRDAAWDKALYQKILSFSLRHTDNIIAVSSTIQKLILQKGIPQRKISLQPHSLKSLILPEVEPFNRDLIYTKYSIPHNKILLFSLGRFVEKKWFHWFLENVLPELDSQKFHYVFAGNWPLETTYRNIIDSKNIFNITLTWSITDPIEKWELFSSMDYFIMPNIHVYGDCEGYGLVLLEAQFYWLPVIANDVDGIWDRLQKKDICLNKDSNLWIKTLNSISNLS